ncbi:DUF4920 domain-containing protein [Tahibacter amnicola]|uniref:DUF4920 domain-containing protein n=1 Tax=Tahibacter amnicola TaxID=2976241 RepID=A0ABY6BGI3_9GAMM|nr:DUF4920 domain-containing protein [Tahibacter amnicola]UXI67480.1 DUF4920 domain-containing protein [Tahibacter amnicola]
MRLIATVAFFGLVAMAASAHDHGHGQPAKAEAAVVDSAGRTYGQALPADAGSAAPLAQVAARPQDFAGKARAFRGRITEICQKQGCWMVLEDDGQFARVFMKDHGFSVPKDASGAAEVYGILTVKTLSAEEIAHLQSEGRSAVKPTELTIEATGVRLSGS